MVLLKLQYLTEKFTQTPIKVYGSKKKRNETQEKQNFFEFISNH